MNSAKLAWTTCWLTYRCGDTITIVDAVYGETNLDRHLEAVKQVSVADKIVISKTDLIDKPHIKNLEDRLHKLNPMASRLYAGSNPVNPNTLLNNRYETKIETNRGFGDKQYQLNTNVEDALPSSHDHRFSTFNLSWPEAIEWDDFVAWLEALLIVRGDNIHRLKGLLNVSEEDQPTVIQGVQHSFYPPTKLDKWPNGIPMTKLVFITSDFSRQAAVKSLAYILDVKVE